MRRLLSFLLLLLVFISGSSLNAPMISASRLPSSGEVEDYVGPDPPPQSHNQPQPGGTPGGNYIVPNLQFPAPPPA
ncbi:hypothetical protein O6H91_19G085300 [Diphasiastrum complanatum]|uniref:Uncharacterized protein n=1 Tax=Diphasiastrum complanatum TaxID=34168 RepID=A0ACC2AXH0_DIPCM|nr:hypothetical protein O6H91_19G085300 [Diphasiastrum complanatum]